MKRVAPANATYLSGRGGAKYQSEATFSEAGIALRAPEVPAKLAADEVRGERRKRETWWV